jgi:hypothetical protein
MVVDPATGALPHHQIKSQEEAMASTTAERDLLVFERKYWQALKDKDVDAALELTDIPCVITGGADVV